MLSCGKISALTSVTSRVKRIYSHLAHGRHHRIYYTTIGLLVWKATYFLYLVKEGTVSFTFHSMVAKIIENEADMSMSSEVRTRRWALTGQGSANLLMAPFPDVQGWDNSPSLTGLPRAWWQGMTHTKTSANVRLHVTATIVSKDKKYSFKCLGPCHQMGKPRLRSWLRTSAWLSPGYCWHLGIQQVNEISLSLSFLSFCLLVA